MAKDHSRRFFLQKGLLAGLTGSAFFSTFGSTLQAAVNKGPQYSNPSDLKITGIKTAFMNGHGTHMFVKLLTNQGIVGYGEAMDAVRGTTGVVLLHLVPWQPAIAVPPFLTSFVLEWHWISKWDRWNDLIMEEPLIKDGYITLSDKPGVGVTPNEKEIKKMAVKDAPFF